MSEYNQDFERNSKLDDHEHEHEAADEDEATRLAHSCAYVHNRSVNRNLLVRFICSV